MNVVFVVCHPDDEALWAGAMLHGLSGLGVRAHVVCASGNDPESPRSAEFQAARAVAGYAGGVVMGGPLREATEPLPDLAPTTLEGLSALGLERSEVSLFVTHPPYGDEHMNPHHIQAFEQVGELARSCGIPFACFSGVAMPHLVHKPALEAPRRAAGGFHLIGMARCRPTAMGTATRVVRPYLRRRLRTPAWWLQFAGDAEVKTQMLACYQSVDLAEHARGYAAWTNAVESLYLMDDAGMDALRPALDAMDTPAQTDIFRGLQPLRSLGRR